MFASISNFFKRLTSNAEVTAFSDSLVKIKSYVDSLKSTLDSIKVVAPATIADKITVFEVALVGLDAEIGLLEKLLPTSVTPVTK